MLGAQVGEGQVVWLRGSLAPVHISLDRAKSEIINKLVGVDFIPILIFKVENTFQDFSFLSPAELEQTLLRGEGGQIL